MGCSNHLVGLINFLSFLLSVPILVGGIWLSTNNTECVKLLQWPLIVIALCTMLTSLAGLAGACYRNTYLMKIYLVLMFLIILVLIGFIAFGYAVTDMGSGREVQNRVYLDYYLQDYDNGWLEKRVTSDRFWTKIMSCVRDHSRVCAKLRRKVPQTADMFYHTNLSPIQSGCCKPLTECGYKYENETVWSDDGEEVGSNPDCSRWSNDQNLLCYECDSCKAGVLASVKKSWRKVSVINIVVVISLVILYFFAYKAYKNNCKIHNCEPHGETRMTKLQPN